MASDWSSDGSGNAELGSAAITSIANTYDGAESNLTVQNSLSSLNGIFSILAVGIVFGLVIMFGKRLSRRLSHGRGGF